MKLKRLKKQQVLMKKNLTRPFKKLTKILYYHSISIKVPVTLPLQLHRHQKKNKLKRIHFNYLNFLIVQPVLQAIVTQIKTIS